MTIFDPAAGFVEHHRQRAVEHAGRAQILEIELLEELCGIHAPNREGEPPLPVLGEIEQDRKSTRQLQSLMRISYAVFCLKKKIAQHAQEDSTAVRHHARFHAKAGAARTASNEG